MAHILYWPSMDASPSMKTFGKEETTLFGLSVEAWVKGPYTRPKRLHLDLSFEA